MQGTRKEIYMKAIEDGFIKATSMYVKPWTLVKMSSLLKQAEWDEQEGIQETWFYDKNKKYIHSGEYGSDEHYLKTKEDLKK
jgi:hypothetical protein